MGGGVRVKCCTVSSETVTTDVSRFRPKACAWYIRGGSSVLRRDSFDDISALVIDNQLLYSAETEP